MTRSYSIRRHLLKWLLLPMLILISIDSTILYHFARKLERKAFDHELLSTAVDVNEFLKKSSTTKLTALDRETAEVLFSDGIDKMYYNVRDDSGNLLLGEAGITLHKTLSKSHTVFSFGEINKQKVRVVSIPASLEVNGQEMSVHIQVAETMNKRKELRDQILVWITLPQLVLLIASGVLVWIGVAQGLRPLNDVNDALNKRSYRDLEPIELHNIPDEINQVIGSINSLMAELRDTINAQNRFIADAAHQLRTPLAGIFAQIELANNAQSILDVQDRLKKISLGSERLIHLVNQLLILAKNQPDAIHQIRFEKLDLVDFVKHVTFELAPNAIFKDIDLGYAGSDAKILINGEKTRLHDLIYNLIENAIRYTANHGKVTTYVSLDGKQACLVVEDNGMGIPEDERSLVFDRFYRSSQSTEFGTGVGLAIVKEIASLHNAKIEISDAKGGIGTEIRVYFPIAEEITPELT